MSSLSPKSPKSSRSFVPEGVVLLIALAVRLRTVFLLSDSPLLLPESGDMRFYHDWALRILGGAWSDGQAFYGLPGYPFYLAVVYAIAGINPMGPALLQSLADAGTAALLCWMVRWILLDRSVSLKTATIAGIVAGLGWAFYQPAIAFSAILMPTSLAVLSLWAVVAWILPPERSRPSWQWLAVGVLTGLSACMVATLLCQLPLVLWRATFGKPAAQSWRRGVVHALLLLVGLGIGTAPCWIHNRHYAHEPVWLSAHSGINFWIGNNPVANGYPRTPAGLRAGQEGLLKDSITLAEREVGRPLRRYEISQHWSEKANAYIRDNRAAWLRLEGTKLLNFWNRFQYDDIGVITIFRELGMVPFGISFGLVALLGIAGMVCSIGWLSRSRLVAWAILFHVVALLPVFVTERYRHAAAPGLLVLGAVGLTFALSNAVQRKFAPLVVWSGALLLSALLVFQPRTDPMLCTLDDYNSAISYLALENLPMAERKLAGVVAASPENAEVQFAMGNLRLAQGDTVAAKAAYRTTVQIDPRHNGGWNNLGALALEEKRWELACKFLKASSELDPGDLGTHLLLARAYAGMDDQPNVQLHLSEAEKLAPADPRIKMVREKILQSVGAPQVSP